MDSNFNRGASRIRGKEMDKDQENEARMDRLVGRAAEIVATGQQAKFPITNPGDHPPCFSGKRQYVNWLEAKASYAPRARPDFPAEPNYCRDCSECFRDKMIEANRCLFPETIFKEVRDADDDPELVGFMRKADRV